METSYSYEQIGTTALAYVTVVNAAKVRQTGHVIGDFTVVFYDPDGVDITGSVAITMDEFEVGGSPTGAYRFSVPISSGADEGSYTLVVTDPLSRVRTCIFRVYNNIEGDLGDQTAQLELKIRETDGTPSTGVVVGDLTVRIYDPDMNEISSTLSPGLEELEAGQYLFEFEIISSDNEGDYFVDIIDAVRFPQGQQGRWKYQLPIPANAPTITNGVSDGTGSSVTLSYTADNPLDVLYTYYSTSGGAWALYGLTRTGSGDIQITGLGEGTYSFYGIASRSGFPTVDQSPPSNMYTIVVQNDTPGAADDNVNVAVRTMKTTAVYWAQDSLDAFGKPTWDTPVQIDCRWTDATEEFIDPNGETQLSHAKLIVDRDLEVKGVMWQGLLVDVVDSSTPKNNPGAWEILQFKKTANFKGNKYLRQVYL
jgi:hypothetical protein